MDYLYRERELRKKNKSLSRPPYIQKHWGENENIVFLTAPHASRHVRDGVVKSVAGEVMTAIIAEDIQAILNNKYKKPVIAIMYKTNDPEDDPNHNEKSNFRKDALNFLKDRKGLLIDLHVMSPKYGADLEIGSNDDKSVKGDYELLDGFMKEFTSRGFKVIKNERFTAAKQFGFSKVIGERCEGIKAFQLEASFGFLYEADLYVEFLTGIVKQIDLYISAHEDEKAPHD